MPIPVGPGEVKSLLHGECLAHDPALEAVGLVTELVRDGQDAALKSNAPDTATSAPRPVKARCSTAARISVPKRFPLILLAQPGPDVHLTRDGQFSSADGLLTDDRTRVEHGEVVCSVLRRPVRPQPVMLDDGAGDLSGG
ncbi:MAG TPA: hypothetical protein VJT49_04305 [Amycolatopsis sp.]|uniref:hypothetical protein n=1 Tax=Amycolatopsis sp. TaxID=37632 RepID=UPI002B46285A|nr:hypothetical protein [Amycolatopsis sp.]HKS44334.1 hypothetical protein [Amycolatopsis sp.]